VSVTDTLQSSPAVSSPFDRRRSTSLVPAGRQPRFSLIVPCFNEEGAIRRTLTELRSTLTAAGDYEIVVVNDGSTDDTSRILTECEREDPALRVVNHGRNRGYGAALKTGIRHAASDLIVITDADGTYPNQRIGELVDLAEHADMVVGARIADDVQYPLIRKIPKVFLRAYAVWIAGQDIPDLNSGMRVFRRSIAERFLNILPDGFSFTTTITLAMLTNRYIVHYVPIGYKARIGRSKIKPIRDTLGFFQLILRTGMYFAPLRIFSPLLTLFFLAFAVSLGYDVAVLGDLREATLLLMILFLNTTMFALLADMIDKRSG
jgi:glycosyltransferase involved in cell wall biosynthesis